MVERRSRRADEFDPILKPVIDLIQVARTLPEKEFSTIGRPLYKPIFIPTVKGNATPSSRSSLQPLAAKFLKRVFWERYVLVVESCHAMIAY